MVEVNQSQSKYWLYFFTFWQHHETDNLLHAIEKL